MVHMYGGIKWKLIMSHSVYYKKENRRVMKMRKYANNEKMEYSGVNI
jgi:hypothetical protein